MAYTFCQKCKKGNLVWYGFAFASWPRLYVHDCDNCGDTVKLNVILAEQKK